MASFLPNITQQIRPRRSVSTASFFGRSSASRFGFSSGPTGMPSVGASKVRPAPSPLIGSIQNISQNVYGEEPASTNVVNRLVTQKVNNLIPNITNRVEQTVNAFDPSALLGKLFGGGLGQLQSFADGLAQLTQPLKQLLDFATQSSQIFAKLIKQLADSGQPTSTGTGRGLLKGMKNLLKGGTIALGAASTGMAVETVMRSQKEPVVTDTSAPPPAPKSSILPAQEGSTKDQIPGTLNIDEIKAFNDAIFKFDRLLSAMLRSKEESTSSPGGGSSSSPQSSMMEPVDPGTPPGNPLSGSGPGAGSMTKQGSFTMGDTVALLKSVGATDQEAIALATRSKYESRGNPMAHNPKHPDNSYGLFQVNMIDDVKNSYYLGRERRQRYGIKNEDLFDPVTNARVALDILRSGGKAGLSAWTTGGNVTAADVKEAEASLSNWKETAQKLGATSVSAHAAKPPGTFTPAPGSTTQPSTVESQARQLASQVISTDATNPSAEDEPTGDTNTTVLPLSMGGQEQPPTKLNPPDSRSASNIPFLIPMKDDVHMMYSRIVYNIVDA